MMDGFSYESEDSQFSDATEQISPGEFDLWISSPKSVAERRMNFIRRLGLSSSDGLEGHSFSKTYCNNGKDGYVHSEAVLTNSCFQEKCSSDSSSMSSWSNEDAELSREVEFCECGKANESSSFHRKGAAEFSQCSCGAQQFSREEEDEGFNGDSPLTMDKRKYKWLSKLRNMACMSARNVKDFDLDSLGQVQGKRMQRIKVRHPRKRSKELSGLFAGQDIQAHDGSISVMKFSLDGRFLASAGEDKLVKVWKIVEDERFDASDIPDADPSCVYFLVNHLSELGPLVVDKDRFQTFKILRKTPESACIVLPPKVFRILEKPLRVFRGHGGEILDLSWSKSNYLLSSSTDKTVRLWSIGIDHCLKVFSHPDYVTCIQFNPVDDDSFISGSIDGKVRIWEISGCHVVKWTETRDIITAASYCPDGKGGILGFITGNCRFFNMSDGHIHLETQICLTSTKKPHCKRVTGFQFLPRDPSRVLVSCADSQVRIINRTEVIAKYKGFRNAGHYTSASFTSDEKHIISASEDSNVYAWNFLGLDEPSLSQPKSIRSFECFSSSNASVATAWPGFKPHENDTVNSLPFSSSHELYSDPSAKGSSSAATWPEEKLPTSTPREMGRSHYKLFKSSYEGLSDSHSWGLVIVAGGWDGRIKSFHNYGLPATL